jgi:hypothetical protein
MFSWISPTLTRDRGIEIAELLGMQIIYFPLNLYLKHMTKINYYQFLRELLVQFQHPVVAKQYFLENFGESFVELN